MDLSSYVEHYTRQFIAIGLALYTCSLAHVMSNTDDDDDESALFKYLALDVLSLLLAGDEVQLGLVLFARCSLGVFGEYVALWAVWELARLWLLRWAHCSVTCSMQSSFLLELRVLRVHKRLGGEMYSCTLWFPLLMLVVTRALHVESALAFALLLMSHERTQFQRQFHRLTPEEYSAAIELSSTRLASLSRAVYTSSAADFSPQDYFYLVFGLAVQRTLRQRRRGLPPLSLLSKWFSAWAVAAATEPAPAVPASQPKLPRKRSLKHIVLGSNGTGGGFSLFQDADFSPSNFLVFEEWDADAEALVGEDEEFVAWLRPREIRVPSVEVVCATQIKQGDVADCWLLSALCAVALRPELISRVLHHLSSSGGGGRGASELDTGRAAVNLFSLETGEWEAVVIDDRLPCDVETKLPMFASARNTQAFWMCMVEKAFAKRYGSYVNLHMGQTRQALVQLTGGFTEMFDLECDVEMTETGAIWDALCEERGGGGGRPKLAVLITNSQPRPATTAPVLIGDHSYALLELGHSAIRLFDPQASTTTTGGGGGDGTFWISKRDVLASFKWACTCEVLGRRTVATGRWGDRVALTIRRQAAAVVLRISLTDTSPPLQQRGGGEGTRSGMMLVLVKGKCRRRAQHQHTLPRCRILASTARYTDARVISLHVKLPVVEGGGGEQQEFTLLPVAGDDSRGGTFRIEYHSGEEEEDGVELAICTWT